MNLDFRRTVFVGFAIFILLLSVTVTAADETEFQVESTNLQIYRDGLVRVTQTLIVNETLPAVTLPLLNSSVNNFIVLDENQTVLDYEVDGIPFEYFVAAAAAVAAIFFVVFLLFRRRGYNIEKIFKMHPRLNKEEKAVIQFLAENEGKVFESQIRERFPDIPRTSLWRLVKRLEKLEILKVKKIGLENQVELKK